MSYETIKTPFLRYIFTFCRIFGLLILPRRFTPLNTLLLALNLAVFYTGVRDLSGSEYFDEARIRGGITEKPFLLLLFKYNAQYNFGLAYLFATMLLLLLDSPLYFKYYQSKGRGQAFCLALAFLIVFLFTFSSIHLDFITNNNRHSHFSRWWKKAAIECALLIDFIYILLPLCIAHYAQRGTLEHLRLISAADVDNQLTIVDIEGVKKSVREVATLNGQIHLLNSPPFAVYLLTNGVDALVSTCRMGVDPDFGFLFFSLFIFAYHLYLCTLTHRTKVVLRRIVQRCEENERGVLADRKAEVELVIPKKDRKRKAPVQADSLLGHYESELGITVFRLFTIDYRYIFLYSLFLLNHSVFLMQTKVEQ
ncbi:hypothetical protein TYRP_003004 [Tyrophagus putrescentiae]|nr:hypothetical protein TYRP_003004 [Tyrophagus putrescentiae]